MTMKEGVKHLRCFTPSQSVEKVRLELGFF